MNVEILHEDNHLICINKPSGILVQSDSTGDESLLDIVKKFIKKRDQKPGNVYLGLIHRIDRPTSGIVVLAKTSKALERMNRMFRQREVEKIYWAIVENQTQKAEEQLIHYLKKNQKNNRVTVFTKPTKDSKEAITKYKRIKPLTNYQLLEVEIFTGRTHQIRAQLAFIGCSVKGDVKYGSRRSNPDRSICLHARSIKFLHPIKKQEIQIKAKPPNLPIWNDCL